MASIIQNHTVVYAAHFYKASREDFSVCPGDIEEVILSHDNIPLDISLAVKVENALHNSYKAIEAVCGGTLPTSEPKLIAKLSQNGINPTELVGYNKFNICEPEKLISKILKLRDARNDRAAHGRVHANRKITFYELMDLQETAGHVLRSYIIGLYPELKPIWYYEADSRET